MGTEGLNSCSGMGKGSRALWRIQPQGNYRLHPGGVLCRGLQAGGLGVRVSGELRRLSYLCPAASCGLVAACTGDLSHGAPSSGIPSYRKAGHQVGVPRSLIFLMLKGAPFEFLLTDRLRD